MITAQDAVDDLYRIAVTEEKATSTSRLDALADFCVQELTRRGLKDVEKESSIPGAGREKNGTSRGSTTASTAWESLSNRSSRTSAAPSPTESTT